MREIKFKYGYSDSINTFEKAFALEEIEQGLQFEEISDSPLLKNYKIVHKRQYTGLKDKNGVEIYEGDIAIIENYNHHGKNAKKTMVIYYDNLTAQYCCKTKQIDCKIDDLTMNNQPLCFAHSIEIIGNIYENLDLIKG